MTNLNLSQTLAERSKSFKEPYEFIFKINENIIVQRFFIVNNYEPISSFSLELKEVLDECVEIIKMELKNKTLAYMDEYKYYFEENPNFEYSDSEDKYYFQIKVNGVVVIEKSWDATIYPVKVRYDVNIKKVISYMIGLIQTVLSTKSKNLTTNYLHHDLIMNKYVSK